MLRLQNSKFCKRSERSVSAERFKESLLGTKMCMQEAKFLFTGHFSPPVNPWSYSNKNKRCRDSMGAILVRYFGDIDGRRWSSLRFAEH